MKKNDWIATRRNYARRCQKRLEVVLDSMALSEDLRKRATLSQAVSDLTYQQVFADSKVADLVEQETINTETGERQCVVVGVPAKPESIQLSFDNK